MDATNPNTADQTLPQVRLDRDGNADLSLITPEDTKKYNELNKSLVITDVNSVLNYGTEVQNSMERYSNEFLTSVRTFNSGEVGGLINDLLAELKVRTEVR